MDHGTRWLWGLTAVLVVATAARIAWLESIPTPDALDACDPAAVDRIEVWAEGARISLHRTDGRWWLAGDAPPVRAAPGAVDGLLRSVCAPWQPGDPLARATVADAPSGVRVARGSEVVRALGVDPADGGSTVVGAARCRHIHPAARLLDADAARWTAPLQGDVLGLRWPAEQPPRVARRTHDGWQTHPADWSPAPEALDAIARDAEALRFTGGAPGSPGTVVLEIEAGGRWIPLDRDGRLDGRPVVGVERLQAPPPSVAPPLLSVARDGAGLTARWRGEALTLRGGHDGWTATPPHPQADLLGAALERLHAVGGAPTALPQGPDPGAVDAVRIEGSDRDGAFELLLLEDGTALARRGTSWVRGPVRPSLTAAWRGALSP